MPIKTHRSGFLSIVFCEHLILFTAFIFIVFSSSRADAKDLETEFLKLQFDSKTGEITFIILDSEKKPIQQIKMPGISLNGEIQNNFQSVEGKARVFQNSSLRLEWEALNPRAVAVTWSTLDNKIHPFELKIADNSSYYGGGERFQAVNQKGFILPMASQDHPEDKGATSYKPVPFYMSSRGYGIWADSYAPGFFDLNSTDRFHCILRYPENRFRIVFFAGPELPEILKSFTELSGRITVPPDWAFAPWKSRDVHRNREEVLQDIELHRKHDLPASVLVIDSPWETGYNNFILNETQFANPEAMFAEIERQGFYVSLWLTPFVNSRNITDMKGIQPGASSNYGEASEKGFLVKNPGGTVMIREWWKGEGGLVDFTNPKAVEWWHEQIDKTRKWRVVRSFKCDDGEGNFVGDAVFADGTSAQKMKNRYAELYLKTMQEYIEKRLGGDGVLITRPGFTGTHKYPFGWSGDNHADFSFTNGLPSVIIAGQTAGLSGLPLFGHDIAGYFGRPNKELFIRWTQFGAFSPLMMVHMTSNLGPWDFDEETLSIYRKFAKLHTSLFPYIYEAAHESRRTGMPIIRAMALAFPKDTEAAKHSFQYLFGPDLLVAPMYQGGTYRTVYLPEGEWIDYWTGKRFQGKQMIEVNAPLDKMPLFVRAGSIIPMLPDDVDTLIRRNDKISKTVVTLDDRRILQVWSGKQVEFSTWEGMTGQLNTNGENGSLMINLQKQMPLEIRFMFREVKNISSKGGGVSSCAYNSKEKATICRLESFKGKAALMW
ncbi:MAG TPA: TIM-barrel domain-containing protein [Pyrinomonadaceae bacterium]|nr:TIM-barrel domain-containing protein [Pyrinomonadaceae bacterium]